jgi:hypothetical protein
MKQTLHGCFFSLGGEKFLLLGEVLTEDVLLMDFLKFLKILLMLLVYELDLEDSQKDLIGIDLSLVKHFHYLTIELQRRTALFLLSPLDACYFGQIIDIA